MRASLVCRQRALDVRAMPGSRICSSSPMMAAQRSGSGVLPSRRWAAARSEVGGRQGRRLLPPFRSGQQLWDDALRQSGRGHPLHARERLWRDPR